MKRGKYSKSAARKPIALVLALVLVLGVAIGGTIAWLTASSQTVTNTFTTSDISIALTESDDLDLQMIPGHTITKDPTVKVDAASEDCYLFVEITKNRSFDTYFEAYAVDTAWTALEGYEGVYYIDVDTAAEKDVDIPVLKDNQVKVRSTVTKGMMKDINDKNVDAPTLSFTAYAIQRNNSNTTQFGAVAAWKEIKGIT